MGEIYENQLDELAFSGAAYCRYFLVIFLHLMKTIYNSYLSYANKDDL